MQTIKIAEHAWVVVCDGRKAVILENRGDSEYPDLRTKETHEHQAASTAALGSGPPGRVHQSVGTARSAVEQTDWHDREEEAFLVDLLKRIDRALAAKEVAHVVVVAPPRALGMLRKHYSGAVKKALAAEIDKDLVAMPVSEIERHLLGPRRT